MKTDRPVSPIECDSRGRAPRELIIGLGIKFSVRWISKLYFDASIILSDHIIIFAKSIFDVAFHCSKLRNSSSSGKNRFRLNFNTVPQSKFAFLSSRQIECDSLGFTCSGSVFFFWPGDVCIDIFGATYQEMKLYGGAGSF